MKKATTSNNNNQDINTEKLKQIKGEKILKLL